MSKPKKFAFILFFFASALATSAYITFWPTPAKDMQTFCDMAKLSHVVSEVKSKTLKKTRTDEFLDFFSELSRMDSSLRYHVTVLKAEDFGLKNWECPALKRMWK